MKPESRNFDAYAFSKQPGYHEPTARREFARAVPLRTVVVTCFDPRAAGVPAAVANRLGDRFPGEIVRAADGRKVASTTTLFPVLVAGGRAIDALRSIAVAQHLFSFENVVVVHHTWCGATSFTAEGIIDAYAREHGRDIAALSDRASLCIRDYRSSLEHDVRLVRMSPATPPHVNVYGYVYDIDAESLTLMIEDKGRSRSAAA